jgi:ring-1,2-phenylacetyl-CoA epoxidase subunit PaaD
MIVADKNKILRILEEVKDPEIPVISVIEMGIVREVTIDSEKDTVHITITPTYSGCPAMQVIEEDIKAALRHEGYPYVTISTVYAPAWTTDWITEEAKTKLSAYGIAPPEKTTSDKSVLMGKAKKLECPRCKSTNTEMISQFGSTACKALYRCLDCLEPFDYFKCI